MIGYFNIRNNDWDPLYLHYSNHTDFLKKIANSLDLELLTPINQVLMQYTNNLQDLNSVLDLIFLCSNAEEFNNHFILSVYQGLSNHALLLVYIIIKNLSKRKN